MEVIDHIEVGAGGAASITFSAIPDTFTDLYILVSARGEFASDYDVFDIYPNGDSANDSTRVLFGNGSSTSSYSESFLRARYSAANATANTFGNTSIYIPNYRSAAAKSLSIDNITENNATQAFQLLTAGLWNVTDPITSITLQSILGEFAEGSSATLYGIRKYNTTLAPKASGGIISFDAVNNKWVHVFTASGTFTPTENLSGVEYLVVAGGGGGGADNGGGGGAGGYRSSVTGESSGGGASAESTLSLTASTNYTVTVGAGGAGATSGSAAKGINGSNSVFDSITATGGGGGATLSNAVGATGGSGGGGATTLSGTNTNAGGSGTANQGFAGGSGTTDNATYRLGGGGGGASAAGANAVAPSTAGAGGAGVYSSITGSSIPRAGGGGGGQGTGTAAAGGIGGGGAGGVNNSSVAIAGSPNTGGGGGGGRGTPAPQNGESGGSGIVIVRYSA